MSSCHHKAPKPAADDKCCLSWWECRLPLLPAGLGRHAAQRHTNLMTRSPLRPTSHLTCLASRETWVQSKNCSAYEPNTAGKQLYGRGPGSELERETSLHSKEGHQLPMLHKLHYTKSHQQVKGKDPCPLLSTADTHTEHVGSTSGLPNTRETRTDLLEQVLQQGPQRWLRNGSISHTRGGWESWKRRDALEGSYQSVEISEGGSRYRFLSLVASHRTRDSGHRLKFHSKHRKKHLQRGW